MSHVTLPGRSAAGLEAAKLRQAAAVIAAIGPESQEKVGKVCGSAFEFDCGAGYS
jgi:hypothetical protein